LLSGIILSAGIVTAVFLITNVFAQTASAPAGNTANVQFPVPELGNCRSETDCRSFCDKPENSQACLSFAEKNNLMSAEEIAAAKKFLAVGKGPGGCTTKDSCENYCNSTDHINECVAFAEKTGILPPQDLAEAKKVQAALARGLTPPGNCKSKQDCDNYCSDPGHMEECVTFAEKAGFMPENEIAEAHKVLAAIKKGAKPPPCRGKAECDAYCAEPVNFEQCISFAEAAGFMTPDEAVMARKTGGKGPGDCKSKEQCEVFCEDPANQEICFNFAKEHGLISQADLQKMEEGRGQMMRGFTQAPPEVMECLTGALGSETIEKLKTGTAMPSRDIGDKMRECFERIGPPGFEGGGAPGGFSGPGGCSSPEECMKFCESNPEACQNFKPSSIMPPVNFEPNNQPPGDFRPPENMQPLEGGTPSGPMPGMMSPQGLLPGQEFNPLQTFSPGSMPPPGSLGGADIMQPPSAEQIQQMMQQGIQQFQQMAPPPESAPPPSGGNLWQAVKDFFSR